MSANAAQTLSEWRSPSSAMLLGLALALARETARDMARDQAITAGALAPETELEEIERAAEMFGGDPIFVEAEVIATAVGRPRLA